MQELVDDIKRLRERHNDSISDSVRHFMHTINTLVDLVGEMHDVLQQCDEAMGYMSEYDIPLCLPDKVKDSAAKSAPIAELVRGKWHG